ncbi:glycoside hydrolase family 16 protein, partial [Aureobasidium melanogenum]
MSFIKLSIAALTATATAYQLVEQHSGSSFFDGFDFFTDADPTHGSVNYTSRSIAAPAKMIGVVLNDDGSAPSAYIGVDSTTVTANRPSVRLVGKQSYNHALVLADIKHMPSGCGVWPALWMTDTGAQWPANGEIDIVEQVNGHDYNSATLHTSSGCAITGNISSGQSDLFSGTLMTPDCDVNSPTQSKNAGCGIRAPSNETFTVGNESCVHSTAGDAFNAQSGGVYAMLWTSAGVSIYFFPRDYIPNDIKAITPDPSTWTSKPQAVFSGNGCNFDSHLKDLQLVINTDLCGDWAGNSWNSDGCAAKTGVATCAEYVQNNPKAFETSFWLFNSISIFSNETTTDN